MIAIVIPAYDMHHQGVHFLRRALESFSQQKQIDFSQMMVVVSDHSVDFVIEEFLKGYQTPFQLHYVRNYTHFGNISQNLNHAIEFVLQNSPANYIKVLFQDDYLLTDDYLAKILHITQETKPDAIITGATHSTDGETYFNPIAPQNNPFLIFGQNTISSPSTLTLSRQVCEQERCDEDVRLFMDVDWYYRILKSYSSIVYAPDLFVVNGVWDGQMQHQFDAQSFTKELAYVLSKYEADQLRGQVPNYLALLHEKHPEHAAIVDTLVRPLSNLSSEINSHSSTFIKDTAKTSTTDHSVDVVLTTLNAVDQINFSIRNALLQSTPPNKIIVVDANFDDHTAQMVQRIYAQEPKVRLITCPNPQIWQARQLGLAQSDSTYIALLNCTPADHSKWSVNYLEQQIKLLEKNLSTIGSLGTIVLSSKKLPSENCITQLPTAGFASNVVLRRQECISNTALADHLRLAEQHHQWQLLAAQFSFKVSPLAQVSTSPQAKMDAGLLNEQIENILEWWSSYSQLILTQDSMLVLIRQAFIGTFTQSKPSLFEHLAIFHHRYQCLKPALNQSLFDRACVSYRSMAGQIIQQHYKQLFALLKQYLAQYSWAMRIRHIFNR